MEGDPTDSVAHAPLTRWATEVWLARDGAPGAFTVGQLHSFWSAMQARSAGGPQGVSSAPDVVIQEQRDL